jgi:hypothetical protein
MKESFPTWLLQNGSVHHSILHKRHHKGALFPLIKTVHQPIMGSVA